MTKRNKLVTFLAIATAATLGCSSKPAIQDYPDSASARQETQNLDDEMRSSKNEKQLDVLSPTNFDKAVSYLDDAKSSLAKGKSDSKTLHYVAESRAYLNRANEVATRAREDLDAVAQAREAAIKAGAPSLVSKDFKATDEKLVDATEDVEKNDNKAALRERIGLQANYLDLELRAIKKAKLDPARDKRDQAIKDGARKFAPRTLAAAEKGIQDADAYITANRHDDAKINELAASTLAASEHALKITNEAKNGKSESPEDVALQLEKEQNSVAMSQSANQSLASKNSSLEAEQALEAQFESARKQFSKDEAEVYKQGNVLTIRLRGLNFPTSQAVLKGSNFPLLSKVEKVIKDFGNSAVTVEGNTDSIGGKKFNEKLSTERAQAVATYLSTNLNDSNVKIDAVGYGDQKPLASNKTATGRAQNRRVDIKIQAEGAATSAPQTESSVQ